MNIYPIVKRVVDFVSALALLVILSPLFIILAILIKRDSQGPVLFRQEREGRRGRVFTMYKFRTMVTDAPCLKEKYSAYNEGAGPLFKIWNDPRLTRFGRFLRDTNLDELPQLWNVLRGDMSFIGPRPFLPEEATQLSGEHKRRLEARPGLVSPWHVCGKYGPGMKFEEWMESDIYYVNHISLPLDVKTFLQVIVTVTRHILLKFL